MNAIPDGGFCLSSFLVINSSQDQGKVIMGRLNPSANWDHIGALDQERIRVHSKGWMLPSCHLIFGESPDDAAKRIQREQLGIEKDLKFKEPKVFSDLYAPKSNPSGPEHWDLGFIFRSELNNEDLEHSSAWSKLEFVDVHSAREKGEIARSHADILGYAGL